MINQQQNVIDLLIKSCEGIRLNAYKDSCGVLTIGVGLARTYLDGTTIREGDTCTEAEAYVWVNQYLIKNVYSSVYKLCNSYNVPTEVFESLCCFAYNEGESPFIQNSFRDAIRTRNWNDLAKTMRLYNKIKINGVLTFSQGLANRREIEINHFKNLLTT